MQRTAVTALNARTSTGREARIKFNKLYKKLRREVGRAIAAYDMIDAGDRVMVCLSGDKDSFTLLESIFSGLQNVVPYQLADINLFDFKHLELLRKAALGKGNMLRSPGKSVGNCL